jgi:hypothetical protein
MRTGIHRHLTIRSSRPHVVASAACFALRLHASAAPPRVGLTQALGPTKGLLMSESISSRLSLLITDDVFSFAQDAQQRLETNDLIVILDMSAVEPELSASPRSTFASSPDLPEKLRNKISKPASSVQKNIKSSHLSFWFIAIHSDEQMDCAALNASMLGPAGNA